MSKFVVCGVGQVGYRIANLLYALGEDITVVSVDIRPAWASEYTDKKIKIILGDARDPVVLKQAGIEKAEVVFVVTSDDTANVEIVLDCKEINPKIRTVARIFDPTLARELEKGIGLDRGLAMSILAAPTIAAIAIDENILGEFRLDGQSLSVAKSTFEDHPKAIIWATEDQRGDLCFHPDQPSETV
ncbi:MAG: NAD-binding protein, partial [Armatimonadetes bacterium]|nr:NAD-binding protein [Armatimonadota bacterium]